MYLLSVALCFLSVIYCFLVVNAFPRIRSSNVVMNSIEPKMSHTYKDGHIIVDAPYDSDFGLDVDDKYTEW